MVMQRASGLIVPLTQSYEDRLRLVAATGAALEGLQRTLVPVVIVDDLRAASAAGAAQLVSGGFVNVASTAPTVTYLVPPLQAPGLPAKVGDPWMTSVVDLAPVNADWTFGIANASRIRVKTILFSLRSTGTPSPSINIYRNWASQTPGYAVGGSEELYSAGPRAAFGALVANTYKSCAFAAELADQVVATQGWPLWSGNSPDGTSDLGGTDQPPAGYLWGGPDRAGIVVPVGGSLGIKITVGATQYDRVRVWMWGDYV